jgi:YD repeat-containing protein
MKGRERCQGRERVSEAGKDRHTQIMLDANGGLNTYVHDPAGRVMRHLDPLSRATTFAYDPARRQTSILDARGVEATFQYDAAKSITW